MEMGAMSRSGRWRRLRRERTNVRARRTNAHECCRKLTRVGQAANRNIGHVTGARALVDVSAEIKKNWNARNLTKPFVKPSVYSPKRRNCNDASVNFVTCATKIRPLWE